jgi:hypothetical protein
MRLLTFAIAAAVTLPLAAATRYSVAIDSTTASVLIDGPRRRIDFVRNAMPFEYDVLLSDDGGKTSIALNTPLKTWFRQELPRGAIPALYGWPRQEKYSLRDVNITASEEPSEPIGGFATRKFVVKTSFTIREDYRGTHVASQVGSTFLVWTTDAVDASLAWPSIDFLAITNLPEVDAQLAPVLAKISGFPLKTVRAATRAYEGGARRTSNRTITVSDIRTVDAPPHAFEKPKGYVEQAPIVSAPVR